MGMVDFNHLEKSGGECSALTAPEVQMQRSFWRAVWQCWGRDGGWGLQVPADRYLGLSDWTETLVWESGEMMRRQAKAQAQAQEGQFLPKSPLSVTMLVA